MTTCERVLSALPCITVLLGCAATRPAALAPTAPQGKSQTLEDPGLSPRLEEDRRILGGRQLRSIEPLPKKHDASHEPTPSVVDTRSSLRLRFESEDELPSANIRIADLAQAAAEYESLQTQIRGLGQPAAAAQLNSAADRSRNFDDPVKRLNLGGQALVTNSFDAKRTLDRIRTTVANARSIIDAQNRRVLVEAFRVSGKTTTSLALPGYNEVGSAKAENTPKEPEKTSKDTVDEAKRTLENAEVAGQRLRDYADSVRSASSQLGRPDAEQMANKIAVLESVATALESAPPSGGPISHNFKDLPPTEIDLAANEIGRGDLVKVNISTVQAGSDGEVDVGADRTLHESYVIDVERIGWCRDDSVAAILARADSAGGSTESSDDANDWKLSLAATFTWQYYDDPSKPKLCDAYHWLQPGFGVHLAALDQTDDELEIGLGAQVSLWEGLLMFGTGANLSARENRTYWLIGGDIIGWTDKIFAKDKE